MRHAHQTCVFIGSLVIDGYSCDKGSLAFKMTSDCLWNSPISWYALRTIKQVLGPAKIGWQLCILHDCALKFRGINIIFLEDD